MTAPTFNLQSSIFNNLVLGAVLACAMPLPAVAQPSVGTISTIAGTGTAGFSGDGSAAAAAQVSAPAGVAVDVGGNVYIADSGNHRIRRISATNGTMSTIAGTGTPGFSGDGGPATEARIQNPKALAINQAGDLFFSADDRIRKITAQTGIISTVAGGGVTEPFMFQGSATNVRLYTQALALDAAGHLYILSAPGSRYAVYRVDAGTGDISTVWSFAIGTFAYGIAVDSAGTLFTSTGRYFSRVSAGTETRFGDGRVGSGLAIDPTGRLHVSSGQWVYLLNTTTGALQPVAGSNWVELGPNISGYGGDGGPATAAQLTREAGLAFDAAGFTYIADAADHRVRKVTPPVPTFELTTVAGTGTAGYTGEGTAAVAGLNFPSGTAVDVNRNVFIADSYNHRIRKMTPSGQISTIAGTGTQGFAGDGGAATSAQLNYPRGVAVDASGNVYVADYANHRVRRIEAATGVISTIAGTGVEGFLGDGGLASSARLNRPTAVAVDAAGHVYIADQFNMRVRRVAAGTRIITTLAGNGTPGAFGDGGPAASAQLNFPQGVAVDRSGNLYIADTYNSRIRKIDASGTITTVAGLSHVPGAGAAGFTGENGPGTSAALNYPSGVAVDAAGNVYLADTVNRRVRKLTVATGILSTVAGNGLLESSGDGWAATAGNLLYPRSVAVDAFGHLYVAEDGHRVRRVAPFAARPTNLTLRRYGPTGVILTWTATPGAASYIVKRGTTPSGQTVYASGITGTIAYIVGSANTRYYFKVSAVVGGAESPNSDEIAITLRANGSRSDLDGDGISDLVIYRPTAQASWFARSSTRGYAGGPGTAIFQWGLVDDVPIAADWDADGRIDPTVWRRSTAEMFALSSSRNFASTQYVYFEGIPRGAQPCVADFDGDGASDICVYDPPLPTFPVGVEGAWGIKLSSEGWGPTSIRVFLWGARGDIPLTTDLDADGKADIGVYRPSTGQWFFLYSSLNYDKERFGYFAWGATGDLPLIGDFDGDAQGDVAVYRPSTGEWFVLVSSTSHNPEQYAYFQWGAAGDQPKLADFDGDGRTDVTVYRPTSGEWFIRYSSRNHSAAQYGYFEWGAIGDVALPGH